MCIVNFVVLDHYFQKFAAQKWLPNSLIIQCCSSVSQTFSLNYFHKTWSLPGAPLTIPLAPKLPERSSRQFLIFDSICLCSGKRSNIETYRLPFLKSWSTFCMLILIDLNDTVWGRKQFTLNYRQRPF